MQYADEYEVFAQCRVEQDVWRHWPRSQIWMNVRAFAPHSWLLDEQVERVEEFLLVVEGGIRIAL